MTSRAQSAVARGHRAEKKLRTRARILENAIALFVRDGVQAARSAEIAAASDVSPATLFNYFPTRPDLAAAWTRGELFGVLLEACEGARDRGLRSALRRACRELAQRSLADAGARLEAWRIVRRPVVVSGEPGFTAGRAALGSMVESEQGRDRIRGDIASTALADLLVDALEGGMIEGLGSVEAELAPDAVDPRLESFLRARVDLVLDGARKKNERVRPLDARRTRAPS
jgi:AcrR family transcriptional regulator